MHYTNHLMIVCGLPYSGMHAIMEWFRPQDDITLLVNNVQRPPVLERQRHPDLSAIPESDLLIVSFEHDSPKTLIAHADEVQFTKHRQRSILLIIRDPLNFYASVLQNWRNLNRTEEQIDSVMRNVVIAWKNLAKEIVGDTEHIPDKIVVNFNLWFCDYSYRQMLSKTLGLRFTDESRDQLATSGGWISSSFDGRNWAGHATEMKVLNRWEKFIHDKTFRRFFDEETKELGHRIYGPWMPVLPEEIK